MNEAEKPELKAGKRIVSQGEYAANVGGKAVLSLSGAILLFIGCLGLGVCFLGFIILMMSLGGAYSSSLTSFLGLLAAASTVMFVLGRHILNTGIAVDTSGLIAGSNTGDLPAPESLVRASEQPLQTQETVLLRAASQANETPVEQLVRPA